MMNKRSKSEFDKLLGKAAEAESISECLRFIDKACKVIEKQKRESRQNGIVVEVAESGILNKNF